MSGCALTIPSPATVIPNGWAICGSARKLGAAARFWAASARLAGDEGPLTPGSRRPGDGAGHVLYGNQHFYTASDLANLTPELISQRTALLDELQAATTDPAAVKALQAARALLEKRLAKLSTARSQPPQPGGAQ